MTNKDLHERAVAKIRAKIALKNIQLNNMLQQKNTGIDLGYPQEFLEIGVEANERDRKVYEYILKTVEANEQKL